MASTPTKTQAAVKSGGPAATGRSGWGVALAVLAATCFGCAEPTYVVQRYPGEPRPAESLAILRINGNAAARLLSLDGEELDVPLRRNGRVHVEILPGEHTLVMTHAEQRFAPHDTLGFVAEAGKVYRGLLEPASGADRRPEWKETWLAHVYLVDRESDQLLRDVSVWKTASLSNAPAKLPPP